MVTIDKIACGQIIGQWSIPEEDWDRYGRIDYVDMDWLSTAMHTDYECYIAGIAAKLNREAEYRMVVTS